MKNYTQKQIDAWKRQYGRLYKVTADGKAAILFDPFTDINICKMAFEAMSQSFHEYVKTIVNNCFLAGDEYIKTDKALLGIADQIQEITEMPEPTVRPSGADTDGWDGMDTVETQNLASPSGNKNPDQYTISCEGYSITVRQATRQDIITAESKNPRGIPFETNTALLGLIGNYDEVSDILKNNQRAFLGILTGVEEVKAKATVSVEKL